MDLPTAFPVVATALPVDAIAWFNFLPLSVFCIVLEWMYYFSSIYLLSHFLLPWLLDTYCDNRNFISCTDNCPANGWPGSILLISGLLELLHIL